MRALGHASHMHAAPTQAPTQPALSIVCEGKVWVWTPQSEAQRTLLYAGHNIWIIETRHTQFRMQRLQADSEPNNVFVLHHAQAKHFLTVERRCLALPQQQLDAALGPGSSLF